MNRRSLARWAHAVADGSARRGLEIATLDIGHCLPRTAAWPCGDLWNLLVALRRVNHAQNYWSRAGRGLVDAEQCLGLVPGDVPTARVFLQGLVGVQPRPEPREVFLCVHHLNLQIKAVR